MNKKTIWVVDDDPVFRMIFSMTLKNIAPGIEVVEFKDGSEALVACGNFVKDPSNLPEKIFLDINMPVMNGWDFLDAAAGKLSEGGCELPPVYIVSSSINPEDKAKAKTYKSTQGYLTKPISKETFIEII